MFRGSVRLLVVLCAWFAAVLMSPAAGDALAQSQPAAKPSTAKPAAKTSAKPSAKAKQPKKKQARKKARKSQSARAAEQQASQNRFAALVVDASTGHVLYEKNAGDPRYPASLTKMMTLYLTFDALKSGRLRLDDTMPVSAKAAGQPQTNISLSEGDRLPVRKAIESLVIRSANDASMVLAEALGDTQWNFALMMTRKARQLGMKDTTFRNPHGLPDTQQVTTAYDMARLGIALRRDFPEYYHFFKLRDFSYNGINYTTHNRVLGRVSGADGIKTGYIRASGFNLVTSVKRGNYNIVAVVMGGSSASARDNTMVTMLDRTFAQLENRARGVARRADAEGFTLEAANDNAPVEVDSAMGGR
ncbi:MAG: D-alanyl-D-alanine carboxypeptidase family protein [Alphaproteobacteria bacterium]|nr:D-alanyl-D-alanine carboxypeptidase family protein [Alphaproteobacteria bacterium]